MRAKKQQLSEKNTRTQPFSEHVRELRRRAFYVVASLLLVSVAGFFIHQHLFNIITRPLHKQLYYTTPTGGFNAIIKISIIFGLIVTVPIMVYHLCKFLSPAFKRRLGVVRIILYSTLLALSGISFAYFVSLPAALHFLANIDSNNLQSIITVNEYLSFVGGYLAGFAILFQLPLIMLFINRIKPQKPGQLMRKQRWVILITFIVAAILTPTPDPLNQFIMAAPIILLYQFSVVLIWLSNRKKTKLVQATIESIEPKIESEPEIIPSQIAIPALVKQQIKSKHKQPLIMDIYWVPHNPGI